MSLINVAIMTATNSDIFLNFMWEDLKGSVQSFRLSKSPHSLSPRASQQTAVGRAYIYVTIICQLTNVISIKIFSYKSSQK